jgi:hypothetical protein
MRWMPLDIIVDSAYCPSKIAVICINSILPTQFAYSDAIPCVASIVSISKPTNCIYHNVS